MQRAGTITNDTITQAIASALKNAVGCFPSSAKIVARRVQRNPRAARNWLDGLNAPRAAEFIELAREFDEIHEVYLHLTNRASHEPSGSEIKQKVYELMQILGEGTHEGNRHRVSHMGRSGFSKKS
jgi:hypothetical protein